MRLPFFALLLVPFALAAFDPAEQDDSKSLIRHFEPGPNPVESPTQQGWIDRPGLTISLMGGTDVFRLQEFGFLEARLQLAFPESFLHVRNLAWPSDTVYRQQRPMYFFTESGDSKEGSLPDGRTKIEPGVLVLSFGKMESLDGIERLGDFEAAYESLVSALKELTPRLVLVGPVPFASTGPAAGLAQGRNKVLDEYGRVIESLAERQGVKWVEPLPLPERGFGPTGVHLSAAGLEDWSMAVAGALGCPLSCPVGEDPERFDALFDAIRQKNRLWDQYFRPTNWAFLYGDRQHVPSSRDHENSDRRWFVEELNEIPALVAGKEQRIWALAAEAKP